MGDNQLTFLKTKTSKNCGVAEAFPTWNILKVKIKIKVFIFPLDKIQLIHNEHTCVQNQHCVTSNEVSESRQQLSTVLCHLVHSWTDIQN